MFFWYNLIVQKENIPLHGGQKIFKHKKLILAVILPLGFWAGLFGFWFFNSDQQSNANPIILKSSGTNQFGQKSISQLASLAATQIDSDKDGLTDWEESIYGTDSKKSDSDGDGYLDGEEVVSSRDPLKKGPDDLIVSSPKNKIEEMTATQKFTELAVANYLTAFQTKNPAEFKPEEIDKILKDSIGNDPSVSAKFNEVLKSELYYFVPSNLDTEIKFAKNDTEKEQKIYFGNITKLLKEFYDTEPKNDFFQTINQSMATKNYSKMDEFAAFYQKMYASAKNIAVPKSLTTNHENLMSYFYKMQKISEAIKIYETDPLKTLLALNELTNLTQKLFAQNQ